MRVFLKKRTYDFIVPNGLQRAEMDKIIQRLINGIHINSDRENILSVTESLKDSGADSIALACTDLKLLLPSSDSIPRFDTMKVLSDTTVREIISL